MSASGSEPGSRRRGWARGHRVAAAAAKSSWLLYTGVFFVFSPIGVLIGFLQPEPPGWSSALLMCALSGAIALGWTVSIQKGGPWLGLIPVLLGVPFSFPWLFGVFDTMGLLGAGAAMSELSRKVILVVAAGVQVSLGFTLVIRYVTLTERREAGYEAELALASRLHGELTPAVDRAGAWGRAIGESRASSQMGGDLIDVVDYGDHADLVLADVSGHGVRAGVVMAMVKTAVRGAGGRDTSLGALVGSVNASLYGLTAPEVFATAWFVRVFAGGRVEAIGCGHPPMLVLDASGGCRRVASEAMPLGIVEELPLVVSELSLDAGERLVVFSDGLSEAGAESGRMLGLDGLTALVADVMTGSRHPDPPRLSKELASDVLTRVDSHARATDDRSLLLVEPCRA